MTRLSLIDTRWDVTSLTFRMVIALPYVLQVSNGQAEVAGVLIARGAAVDYQDKVRQSCMIRIITVVLKNSMIVGIIIIMSAWGDVSRAPVHT